VTVPGLVSARRTAVRSGTLPPLADGFIRRPESAPFPARMIPGTAVALVDVAVDRPGPPTGSCGKTQLAAAAAQALWRSGHVELVAWVDASSRASVLAGYAEAAAAAGIECAGPAERMAAGLTGWLADTTVPWLMVLDDVRDPADLDGLWPRGPAGTVVITTQDEQTACGAAGDFNAEVIPVGPFTTREALSYLMERLADDPDQRHGAIDLALALDGAPLALAQASTVIATSTQSCADYQRRYGELRARLTDQARGELTPTSAITAMLSADRASQLAPGGVTQILLPVAALSDGHAIPATLFTTPAMCTYLAESGARATDPDSAWHAVHALARTGLLTLDLTVDPPLARMSRTIAALVRAAIPGQVLERAAVAAAGALLAIWPQPEPQPWLASGIRSCADALQRTAGDRLWAANTPHPLLLKAGHSLDAAGLTGPAVRHWSEFATASQRILGLGSPHTLAGGSHLAGALLAAGQASEATAWWQWVVSGRTRADGPDHPATLAARTSLGRAMTAAGQHSNAVTVLEQGVIDHERVRGPAHPDTFTTRAVLAAACQAAGLAAQAIGHYQRILADHERINGPRHPATITTRGQLAAACLADGRHKDAISYYKKMLADQQHTLGADHIDTITTRRDLAAAYQAAGKIAAALQLHEQACAGHEQVLGADHPDTLACRTDLANAYLAAGRLADAAAMLRDTLTRCEQALPEAAPLTTAVRQALTGLADP
jgi:tetratricopeptide (TPR) repeat protein